MQKERTFAEGLEKTDRRAEGREGLQRGLPGEGKASVKREETSPIRRIIGYPRALLGGQRTNLGGEGDGAI